MAQGARPRLTFGDRTTVVSPESIVGFFAPGRVGPGVAATCVGGATRIVWASLLSKLELAWPIVCNAFVMSAAVG